MNLDMRVACMSLAFLHNLGYRVMRMDGVDIALRNGGSTDEFLEAMMDQTRIVPCRYGDMVFDYLRNYASDRFAMRWRNAKSVLDRDVLAAAVAFYEWQFEPTDEYLFVNGNDFVILDSFTQVVFNVFFDVVKHQKKRPVPRKITEFMSESDIELLILDNMLLKMKQEKLYTYQTSKYGLVFKGEFDDDDGVHVRIITCCQRCSFTQEVRACVNDEYYETRKCLDGDTSTLGLTFSDPFAIQRLLMFLRDGRVRPNLPEAMDLDVKILLDEFEVERKRNQEWKEWLRSDYL